MSALAFRRAGRAGLHGVLLAGAAVMLFPFAWMLLASLKSQPDILAHPLRPWPQPWTWSNYPTSWHAAPFARAYFNSVLIAAFVVGGTLLTAAMAAYGFARLRFRGSTALFVCFLATMMVPRQVTLIPTYWLMSRLGWVDNPLAIIVPGALFNPFAIFLLVQFVRAVPLELEEAALLDGASRWGVFWGVVLPNVRPGLAAVGIIVFLDTWNNFLYPLVFLNSPEKFTVPLLLAQFSSAHHIDYGQLMAGTAISVVPVLIVYAIAQRAIIESMAASGMGGR